MSEANYNVEEVLAHEPETAKTAADAKKYHIKWEGFDDDQNSWEPVENLNDTIINEYWKLKNQADTKISAEKVAAEVTDDDMEEEVTAKNEPEAKEYVVEAITGVKPRSATCDEEAQQYTIKWEGYDEPKDKTTERASSIRESAPDAVADFWKAKNAKANEAEKDDEEIEIKISSRGRKIKKVVNPVKTEPVPPSKKKTKITPSKPKKRASPVKNEKTSPSSKLDQMNQEDIENNVHEIVNDLRDRVARLETKQPQTDRQFIISLGNREEMPAEIVNVINHYLNTGKY